MFDNYYDNCDWQRKIGLDNFGNITYQPSITINCREVTGKTNYIINKEGTSIKFTKVYQIPSTDIQEGDKINNRLVLYVDVVKDVFGKFVYSIVGVE